MPDTEINARRLATIDSAANEFAAAGQTVAAIRCAIWRAADRRDPRCNLIRGNGLAATGAIIRRGRRVLIDLDRYAAWLSGAA